MKVLIVASDKAELKAFEGKDCYIPVACGIGIAQAAVYTALAIKEHDPDAVVSVGSAGGISEKAVIGSVISFDRVIDTDQDMTLFRLPLGSVLAPDRSTIGEMRFALGDDNTLCCSSKFASGKPSVEADAADMESYGVALASTVLKKRCLCFKLITDRVGEHTKLADYRRMVREGREELEKKVRETLGL